MANFGYLVFVQFMGKLKVQFVSFLMAVFFAVVLPSPVQAQKKQSYTHDDSLKGVYSLERAWWDVLHYDLHVAFNPTDSSIKGYNKINYKILAAAKPMQIDLMTPMVIDSIVQAGKKCGFRKDGDAYFVSCAAEQTVGRLQNLSVWFHGKPKVAANPPWDGGIVWARDNNGNPWISLACQGMSSRVWFPNKDHMADEPDSADMYFECPAGLVAVSNGRVKGMTLGNNTFIFHWQVKNPINNYNIIPYIGKYVSLKDTIVGLKGVLDLEYWVLNSNYLKAEKHFTQVKSMLHCFEYWFGPYPFYEDSYKLVEAPYLGMEHQSGVAYGNNYMNGYRGRDLSLTGWGLKWDFIIVHESGHEWFGNNISARDVADNWIHESFTAYSENLYVEWLYGKKAGAEYVIGTRKSVLNDKPMIGDYNVNRDGSGDVYYKGANLLHTIRCMVNNDSLWRETLTGLNTKFWHKTVTTAEIENYIASKTGLSLAKVFDQYLRASNLPVMEYRIKKGKLEYHWTSCVKGFNMPLQIITDGGVVEIKPEEKWKKIKIAGNQIKVDDNYFVLSRQIN